MKPHSTSIGLLPSHDPAASHGNAVNRCLCGGHVVWAFDDLYPEKALGVLVNAEPTQAGSLLLWYEITAAGRPVGKQWFRELDPAHPYQGPRWERHACWGVRP